MLVIAAVGLLVGGAVVVFVGGSVVSGWWLVVGGWWLCVWLCFCDVSLLRFPFVFRNCCVLGFLYCCDCIISSIEIMFCRKKDDRI